MIKTLFLISTLYLSGCVLRSSQDIEDPRPYTLQCIRVPDVTQSDLFEAISTVLMRQGHYVIPEKSDMSLGIVVTDVDRTSIYGCDFTIGWTATIHSQVVCLTADWATKNSSPPVCFRAADMWEETARDYLIKIRTEALLYVEE